jgi:hypothetical protein
MGGRGRSSIVGAAGPGREAHRGGAGPKSNKSQASALVRPSWTRPLVGEYGQVGPERQSLDFKRLRCVLLGA